MFVFPQSTQLNWSCGIQRAAPLSTHNSALSSCPQAKINAVWQISLPNMCRHGHIAHVPVQQQPRESTKDCKALNDSSVCWSEICRECVWHCWNCKSNVASTVGICVGAWTKYKLCLLDLYSLSLTESKSILLTPTSLQITGHRVVKWFTVKSLSTGENVQYNILNFIPVIQYCDVAKWFRKTIY